ncbi:hypothetical protein QE152_g29107 [Popillia japonica]|uniref:Reverse transcriptase n=1 Tax=Popillia japonica TaxID=7064 RepID=A0AAW1JJ60_POPJA
MVAWSANGLKEKRAELVQFILDLDADMVMVGETWLRPGDRLCITNYKVHRSDRLIGVAIAIKKHLRHNLLPIPGLQLLEVVRVQIKVRGFGPMNIFPVYAPPTRGFVVESLQLFIPL